jgi:endonuclease/exonuclease/phosphatase family metal-dependent hydrolase
MTGSVSGRRPLRLVSWNILAAPWAGPQWYPRDMDRAVLDRVGRRARIAAAIQSLGPDLCCLQEATPADLDVIRCGLGDRWQAHFASNGPSLWSNWGSPEIEWEPNGTAIVWDADRITCLEQGTIDLGPHGNVATWAQLCDTSAAREAIVVSLHLDSDDPDRRRAELVPLFAAIDDAAPDGVAVVIAGDYNEDTIDAGASSGSFGGEFFDRGFDDALARLGRHDPTHAYARPGDDWAALATIDHVMVRGVAATDGRVVDAGLWDIESAATRMEACLRRTGSDHLALYIDLDTSTT